MKMKKFSVLSIVLVGLVFVGCATYGVVPKPSNEPTKFEGVWMKEDGTTLTITGNQFRIVNMSLDGYTGYGTFKDNGVFENTNINVIVFFYPAIFKFNQDCATYYWPAGGKPVRKLLDLKKLKLLDFQIEDYNKWKILYPEQIKKLEDDSWKRLADLKEQYGGMILETGSRASGNYWFSYNFEKDKLVIEYPGDHNDPGKHFIFFIGTYKKQ
jgi:hypothetical protein